MHPAFLFTALALLTIQTWAHVNLTLAIVAPDPRHYDNNDLGSKASLQGQIEVAPFILQDLNQRLAHPRGVHFDIKHYDTRQTQLGSVEAAIAAQRDGKAIGKLGEWASYGTIPVALTSTSFGVPMCSGTASSDKLSDKAHFPLFFRTIAPDKLQGAFVAQVMMRWNWTRVNLLVGNEPYGLSVQAAFKAEAARLNVTIERTIMVQKEWTQWEYDNMADQLAISSTRVVAALMLPDVYTKIALTIQSRGLSKSFTFIGGDALVSTLDSAQSLLNRNVTQKEMMDLFDGLFFAWPAETPRGSTRHNTMLEAWLRAGNLASTWTTAYALFGASCIEALVAGWLGIIDRVGIGAVVNRTYSVALNDFLKPLETVSGHVVFDANGDRAASFELRNFQNATTVPVVYSENGTLTALRDPLFPNGSNTIPPWEATYTINNPSMSMPGVVAILVLTGLTMAFVALSWSYLLIHRDSRRVKHLGISFTSVLCMGLLLALSSTFQMVGVPTKETCASQYWTIILGYSLCLASLWIRSYRIRKVFDNRVLSKTTSVQTRALVQRMFVLPAVQVLLLLTLQFVSPLRPTRVIVSGLSAEYFCMDSEPDLSGAAQKDSLSPARLLGTIMLYVAGGLDGVLLAMLAWVSVKLRSVHTAFKDTLYIAYTIHNLIFSGIIAAILITLFDKNSTILFFIKSCAILYSCLVVYVCMVARHAFSIQTDGKSEASSRPSGALETRMIETIMPGGGGGTTQIKVSTASSSSHTSHSGAAYSAVIPVKFCGWIMRKWEVCHIILYAKEGNLCVFPTTANHSDPVKGHGLTYRLRKCVVDTEPDDEPQGAVALSCAGTDAIVLMFPSVAERDKWSGAFLQVATAKATAPHLGRGWSSKMMTKSGSKNGLARRSSSAKQFSALATRAATISVTSGASAEEEPHIVFPDEPEEVVVPTAVMETGQPGNTRTSP